MAVPARVELPEGHPLAAPVGEFQGDLTNVGRGPRTVRGYRDDLAGLAVAHTGGVGRDHRRGAAGLVGAALQSLTFSPRLLTFIPREPLTFPSRSTASEQCRRSTGGAERDMA
jgi:hypothetical protein